MKLNYFFPILALILLTLACDDDNNDINVPSSNRTALDYIYELALSSPTHSLNVNDGTFWAMDTDNNDVHITGPITFLSKEQFKQGSKIVNVYVCRDYPQNNSDNINMCVGHYEYQLEIVPSKRTSTKVVCLNDDNEELSFTAR